MVEASCGDREENAFEQCGCGDSQIGREGERGVSTSRMSALRHRRVLANANLLGEESDARATGRNEAAVKMPTGKEGVDNVLQHSL